jgi:hypothetical protein
MPRQKQKDEMNTSLASTDAANASDTTTSMTYPVQQPIASSYAVNDGHWRPRTLRGAIARVMRSIRSFGPYVAIELILPGGSIIALALWTYRHRRAARASANTVSSAVVPAVRRTQLRCVTTCTQR